MSTGKIPQINNLLRNLANAVDTVGVDSVNELLSSVSNVSPQIVDYTIGLIKQEYLCDFFVFDNISKRGDYACARGMFCLIIKQYLGLSLNKIAEEFPKKTSREAVAKCIDKINQEMNSPIPNVRIKHSRAYSMICSEIDKYISSCKQLAETTSLTFG